MIVAAPTPYVFDLATASAILLPTMSPLVRVLLGLFIMVVGFVIVKKTDLFRSWFGEIPWAEEHLGNGGTRLFYKLLGAACAVMGVFIATGIMSDIMNGLVSVFIRKPNP